MSWLLDMQITRPLEVLVEADTDAEEPSRIELSSIAQLRQLQLKFLELLNRQNELEEQISSTGLPAPEDEDQRLSKAERRMTTLVAIEVVNIQTVIELLHPGTLSTLLQQFQFYVRQSARLYRGVVTRMHGDMALLTFDIRHCQEDHAFNALCFSQLFTLLMQQVADAQKQKKAQSLEFKIAVHSGDAYFSPLWRKAKQDQDTPRQESVIGKPVDLVQQLLNHSSNGTILVSKLTYDLADGQRRFGLPQAREVTLADMNMNLNTYILPASAGTHAELLQRQCRHLLPEQQPQQGKTD